MLDAQATRYGRWNTQEGQIFANFLRQNQGKYDGVILSLPNFGMKMEPLAALKESGVPILVQAYPDEFDRMAPGVTEGRFFVKFSIMDVFYQHNLKFTALKPHTVSPSSERFKANLDHFDRLCHVVKGFHTW